MDTLRKDFMQANEKARYHVIIKYRRGNEIPESAYWCVRNALGETLEAKPLVLGCLDVSIKRRSEGEEGHVPMKVSEVDYRCIAVSSLTR